MILMIAFLVSTLKKENSKKSRLTEQCLIKTNTYVKLKAYDNLKIFDQ